jgi:hypothetical protein
LFLDLKENTIIFGCLDGVFYSLKTQTLEQHVSLLKVVGLFFLNSPLRWSTYFLVLSTFVLSLVEGVPLDELFPFSTFVP